MGRSSNEEKAKNGTPFRVPLGTLPLHFMFGLFLATFLVSAVSSTEKRWDCVDDVGRRSIPPREMHRTVRVLVLLLTVRTLSAGARESAWGGAVGG